MTNDHKALIARARKRAKVCEVEVEYVRRYSKQDISSAQWAATEAARILSQAADWRALADALERAQDEYVCGRCGYQP